MTQGDEHLEDLRSILDAAQNGVPLPQDRLDALAHRYLAASREGRGRIDPAEFARAIRSELTGRFLHQGRAPDEMQASRMLSAALRRALVDVEDRTHFIPCRIFEGSGPAALAVGPVEFRRTTAFRESHIAAIAADPEFSALVERDFAPWGWTAEVTVRGCDRVVSRQRALNAVDRALDMLRLFAGADAARSLGRAGAPGLPPVTPGGLWADSGGRLHPVRPEGETGADESAILQQLHGIAGRDWLTRAGETLKPLADPSLSWPLAARFREAAAWFGEGVTEAPPAARILAFVTAIERAVVAGDHADVWRSVTSRAAILAESAAGGAVEDWLRQAELVYEIRSQIIHGGMSPFDPEVGARAPVAARLARAALQGVLGFLESLGLAQARYSADRLEKEYRKLEGRK